MEASTPRPVLDSCDDGVAALPLERPKAFSIDFFETLFIRAVANPEDLFDLLGRQLGIPDFRDRRIMAQARGFERMRTHGRSEVTLADIYACFGEAPISVDEIAEAEVSLELALLRPNPDLFWLLRELIAAGRPVVITSDMYLPVAFFQAVLDRFGVGGVPVLVSCDCNATKRDRGSLFDRVILHFGLPPGDILHIGDNPLSDLQRPREKGLRAFLYRAQTPSGVVASQSIAASLALGLLRCTNNGMPHNSREELGFLVGGPAAVGFLLWIAEQAKNDGVSRVLFLARDGYSLERLARSHAFPGLPEFNYLLGSRTAFTLAAMTADNFQHFMEFLLSGSDGLAPEELLERIGVAPPTPDVMADLGLGEGVRVGPENREAVQRFLWALRWAILRAAQETRRALFRYLGHMGIRDGDRVALVDVGWGGTTQEAFAAATSGLFDLDIVGYYLCLADTPQRHHRSELQRMRALVDAPLFQVDTTHDLHLNRVTVERFFSAPHDTVIGLTRSGDGIAPIFDRGRGDSDGLADTAEEINLGVQAFAAAYFNFAKDLGIALSPAELVAPLIDYAISPNRGHDPLFADSGGFDAWGSSRFTRATRSAAPGAGWHRPGVA